jgi:PAS domain-containing protein
VQNGEPFIQNGDAGTLAQAIVDTVREPLLVLDKDLRVLAASRSFYQAFEITPSSALGQVFYELGNGQWDIPGLRLLLEKIVPEHSVMEDYEVEQQLPEIGKRTMLLNARKVVYEGTPIRPFFWASKTSPPPRKRGIAAKAAGPSEREGFAA